MNLSDAELAAQTIAARLGEEKVTLVRNGLSVVFVSNQFAFKISTDAAKSKRTATIAKSLADIGYAAISPVTNEVELVNDLAVTTWQRAEHIERQDIDMAWIGKALFDLHRSSDALPANVLEYLEPFPVYERRRHFTRTRKFRDGGGDPAIVDELESRFDSAADVLLVANDQRVFCHGDPHRSNVMKIHDEYGFIDWDDATLAPAEFDLGRIVLQLRFGQSSAETEAVLNSYGSYDEDALEAARKVCEALSISWSAELSLERPEVADELIHRMKTIDDSSEWWPF